jgi:retron-type reverse transcriptase
MTKEDTSIWNILRTHNVVDSVLQLQMLTFIDPLIDAILPEHFYGFRRGRSSLQAIAYLSSSIQLSDISRYHLVFVDIWKCFDSISHEFIQERLPFPIKYKGLLMRWIKCFRARKFGEKGRV